jgi:hypothetical protein
MLTSLTALLDASPSILVLHSGSFLAWLPCMHMCWVQLTDVCQMAQSSKGTLISVQTVVQGDHYRSLTCCMCSAVTSELVASMHKQLGL